MIPRRSESGYSLVDLLVSMALLGTLSAFGLSPFLSWSSGLRVELAAQEVAGVFHMSRMYAVRNSRKVAVKFWVTADGVSYGLYRDGDGDGVKTADIERGIDPEERAPRPLERFAKGVGFGFPPGPAPREPGKSGRRLKRLEDPIRFNRSDLASFTPLGTATSGTVYITDGRRHLVAVRVNNRSGKITVLRYDPEKEVWR